MITAPLAVAIQQALSQRPDDEAIHIDGQSLTKRQFSHAIDTRVQELAAHGIDHGDHVVVLACRRAQFWIDLCALWTLGSVVIPLEEHMVRTTAHIVTDLSKPRAVLGEAVIICNNTFHSSPQIALGAQLYTSGSTGSPKGVELTQAALLANVFSTIQALPISRGQRVVVGVPSHSTSAINHFLCCLLAGATFVSTDRRLLPADWADFLAEANASAFGGAPIHVRYLIETGAINTRRLAWIMSSGDRLNPDVIRFLHETTPDTRLIVAYGLTELGGRFCVRPPHLGQTAMESVGRPLSGFFVTIRNEHAQLAGPGTIGHVYAQGPSLFSGYSGMDAEERTRMLIHGFNTGDLGYLDGEGLLYLVGRTDDVFKVSAKKVSGLRIADALMETGIFTDVFVVGVPDSMLGTAPCAYVVLRDQKANFSETAVRQQLRRILSADEVPRYFRVIDQIPRTSSGKVARQELERLERSSGA